MKIYDYGDYKRFVRESVVQLPRGAYRQMAEALGVQSSFVAQVFRGDKELSAEQGFLLADFLALDPRESRYLVLLIQKARASRATYREFIEGELAALRARVSTEDESPRRFDRAARTLFYSAWYYSAIHLLTTLPTGGSVVEISRKLGLGASLVQGVLDFLVSAGLCLASDGVYRASVLATAIEDERELSIAHNTNWRHKGVERIPTQRGGEDFFFTNVVSLSAGDAEKIHARLREALAELTPVIADSPAERLYCLNLDWFGV